MRERLFLHQSAHGLRAKDGLETSVHHRPGGVICGLALRADGGGLGDGGFGGGLGEMGTEPGGEGSSGSATGCGGAAAMPTIGKVTQRVNSDPQHSRPLPAIRRDNNMEWDHFLQTSNCPKYWLASAADTSFR